VHVVLHLSRTVTGELRGVLDSPDQGASGLPVSKLTLQDGTLHFEMPLIGATYDGRVAASGNDITGEWRQQKLALPLTFTLEPARN
jgi:hypothetical protein